MTGQARWIGRRLFFALDPERAHALSLAALKSRALPVRRPALDERLSTEIAGIIFPNPLGMAAGFDKDAAVPDALLSLGFGFVECGTVTPLPQPGNPKPRIFRLEADEAVINRLGFNSGGHAAFRERLVRRGNRRGVVGVNIGANKDSRDRIADYEAGVRLFAPLASYLTVNISSPNTAGLRTLQVGDRLAELLTRVMTARAKACADTERPTPIFLKIAPDLDEQQMTEIAAAIARHGVDGLVVSNTTLSRAGLSGGTSRKIGGLSGKPLFERSTIVLARMRRLVGPDLPIIGVGGVDSAEAALEKIRAGADLVQLYTAMIYAGPFLPGRILRGMESYLRNQGLSRLAEIRDSRVEQWAELHLSEDGARA